MTRWSFAGLIGMLLCTAACSSSSEEAPSNGPPANTQVAPDTAPCVRGQDCAMTLNVAKQVGIVLPDGVLPGEGIGWTDANGDGWADLVVPTIAVDRLYLNQQNGTFVDATEWAGMTTAAPSESVWSFDIDNDGDEDLFFGTWISMLPVLYVNDGSGRYVDRAADMLPDSARIESIDAAVADFNEDGFLDIAYGGEAVDPTMANDHFAGWSVGDLETEGCNWSIDGPRDGIGTSHSCDNPDDEAPSGLALLINQGGQGFIDGFAASGIVLNNKLQVVTPADLDGDGHVDLFLGYSGDDDQVWRGRGDGTFEDVTAQYGFTACTAAMGFDVADLDGDAQPEVWITDNLNTRDKLYSGGVPFVESGAAHGIDASDAVESWGVHLEDLDNDGHMDAAIAGGWSAVGCYGGAQRTMFFYGDGTGMLAAHVPASGDALREEFSSRGSAVADYDHDGDLDIAIGNPIFEPQLLRNETAPSHWLTVVLAGKRPFQPGIRVSLHAGGRVRHAWTKRSQSYGSSSAPIVHFGLGDIEQVDTLEFHLPGGVHTVSVDEIDRRLVVELPE